MRRPVRVEMVFSLGSDYEREVVTGFHEAALAWRWAVHVTSPRNKPWQAVSAMHPNALVLSVEVMESTRRLAKLCPCVGVGVGNWGRIPSVDVDDVAVGRMAAEYLARKPCVQVGVFGSLGAKSPRTRGFLEAAGPNVAIFEGWFIAGMFRQREATGWLRQLRKPAGILATSDALARELMILCRCLKLRIPEDIAIVGVDNDSLMCQLAHPPLTSISIPWRKIGATAAERVAGLLNGQPIPPRTLVQPNGLVARQSSDLLEVADEDIRAVLTLIQKEFRSPLSVTEILRRVPVSQHRLERLFLKVTGRRVLDELRRRRVEEAGRLLQTTRLPLDAIAIHSGFANAKRLSEAFRRELKTTPIQYREAFSR